MFWAGMAIFIVLAVLPLATAAILNAKDGASLTDRDLPPSPIREGR
jgi:hypothetical protein